MTQSTAATPRREAAANACICIPTLVRLLPKACRRKQKGQPRVVLDGGLTLLSRRQYLSRMDRFQHERSGANFRTMSAVDQSIIAAISQYLVALSIDCS